MQKYLFADESGNFDFSANKGATQYFAVGTLMIVGEDKMRALRDDLANLRYELPRTACLTTSPSTHPRTRSTSATLSSTSYSAMTSRST